METFPFLHLSEPAVYKCLYLGKWPQEVPGGVFLSLKEIHTHSVGKTEWRKAAGAIVVC